MESANETILRWVAAGERVAVATVVETARSSPRPVGCKLAICASGGLTGAVSGGCVEGAVVETARRILAGAPPQLLHFGYADELTGDAGLPCDGQISVFVAPLDEPLARFLTAGPGATLVTRLDTGARVLCGVEGSLTGTLGTAELDACARRRLDPGLFESAGVPLFAELIAPRPRLIVIGAVDFAAPLSEFATATGWRTFVVDPRPLFASAQRFPAAERVIAAWPHEAFAQLAPVGPDDAVAVLTHDPKLDDAAVIAALSTPAGYIGAMGSRRACERRAARLIAAGVSEAELSRVASPIGLDLGGRSPAETALAIAAEITAARYGRSGARLAQTSGPIHADNDRAACSLA